MIEPAIKRANDPFLWTGVKTKFSKSLKGEDEIEQFDIDDSEHSEKYNLKAAMVNGTLVLQFMKISMVNGTLVLQSKRSNEMYDVPRRVD